MAASTNESGSSAKRLKIEDSDLFASFHETYLSENPSFINAVDKFKLEMTALGAFDIGSCNAADPDNGYCFTKAECTLRPTQKKYAFANFFFDGFKMLKTFLTKKEIPKDSQQRLILGRLVGFLLDREIQKALSQTKECCDETELTILLAFHLFSQLSASPHFTVDNRKANQPKECPCRERHGRVTYGDTSIGSRDAWHGRLDLIMEGADVIVDTLDGDSDVDRTEDVKQRFFEDNSAGSSLVQVAAKTIVHSFYYRQIHPELSITLIPCIAVSHHVGLIFYFYDSVNDILLGSTQFPLASFSPFQLNMTAIIAVWLVLNHKYLCNGFSMTDLEEVPRAHFVDVAGTKIDVYREELQRGGVETRRFDAANLDPLLFVNSRFILSPLLEDS